MGRNLSQVSDPIGSTELASDIGSALVGHTPAGTGAVPTTVRSKLREVVSVKDFGADATATATANAAAIQAAFDSGHKSIYIPDGDYYVDNSTTPLNLSGEGITVFGEGRLYFSSYAVSGIYVTGARCKVTGIEVHGPGGANPGNVGPTSGILKAFRSALIAVVGVTSVDTPALMNVTIDNVRVVNPGILGINVYKAVGCNVTNCRVESSYPLASLVGKSDFCGISFYTSARFNAIGNTVNGFCQGIYVGALGISYSFNDYAGTTATTARNFIISDNRIEAQYDHSIYVSNDAEKYTVTGNYLWAASFAEGGAGSGSLKLEGRKFTAGNNVCRDGIVLRNVAECVIDANFAPIYTAFGQGANTGGKYGLLHEEVIFKRPSFDITISNNVFKVEGDIETTAGIYVAGKVWDGYQSILSRIDISGNTIVGFGKNSANGHGIRVRQELLTSGGIVVDSPARNVSITDNNIAMNASVAGSGMYGVSLEGAINEAIVSGNLMRNISLIGVHSLGVRDSFFEGNTVVANNAAAFSRYGFFERVDSSLTLHVESERNTYGINTIVGTGFTRKYWYAKESTFVHDKVPLSTSATNSNIDVTATNQIDIFIWSPTTAGLEFALSNDQPWSIGQTFTILNRGTQSFNVRHPNGTTVNTITAGNALKYVCTGSNVMVNFV